MLLYNTIQVLQFLFPPKLIRTPISFTSIVVQIAQSFDMTDKESQYEGAQSSVIADKPLDALAHSESNSGTRPRASGQMRTADDNDTAARCAEEGSYLEGYVSEATRHISALDIASIGWSICNSWVGVVATLAFNISNGGSPGLLYGLWFVFIMYGCIVYTLAELCRVYPSAGGQ